MRALQYITIKSTGSEEEKNYRNLLITFSIVQIPPSTPSM